MSDSYQSEQVKPGEEKFEDDKRERGMELVCVSCNDILALSLSRDEWSSLWQICVAIF